MLVKLQKVIFFSKVKVQHRLAFHYILKESVFSQCDKQKPIKLYKMQILYLSTCTCMNMQICPSVYPKNILKVEWTS